MKEMCALKQR